LIVYGILARKGQQQGKLEWAKAREARTFVSGFLFFRKMEKELD